jgi:glutamine synthetase
MLMAALDGIQTRTSPGEPLDKDIYDIEPEELDSVPSTPHILSESLDALAADHEFLLRGDVFTKDVIDTWIWYKKTHEVEAIRERPHPYEFVLYYDV